MCLCLGAVGEETGGLEDHINTQVLPGEVLGVALGEDLDFLAANNQCAFLDLNLFAEATHDRVVLEQVCQGLNVGEVVDSDDLEADAFLLSCAEEGAADAAEAVDCYAYSHWSISLSVRWVATRPIRCLVGIMLTELLRALWCPARSAVVGNNPTLVCVCFGVLIREFFVSYPIKWAKNPLFSVGLRGVRPEKMLRYSLNNNKYTRCPFAEKPRRIKAR